MAAAEAYERGVVADIHSGLSFKPALALQLLYRKASESMGNHDSEIMDAGSVD